MWPYWLGGGLAVGAVAIAIIAFATSSGGNQAAATPTPAPPAGAPIDGIKCESEMVQTHYHAHLTLLDNGKEVTLPAGIGINQQAGCLYWLHTHQTDGIIHIESPGPSSFTLGQFFDIWGQPLSSTRAGPIAAPSGEQLHVYVDGAPASGDPRSIQLKAHQVLVLEVGTEVPPPGYSFPPGL